MVEIGQVITMRDSYGFINCCDYKDNIYFNFKSCFNQVSLNDMVTFKVKRVKDRLRASKVKRVFINGDGVLFIASRSFGKFCPDAGMYFSQIIDEIDIQWDKKILNMEFHFQNPVGDMIIVPTSPEDSIVFAIRKGRTYHSRFVKGRSPCTTSNFCVVLEKSNDAWLILKAIPGNRYYPEPWSKNAVQESLVFWRHHAFIYQKDLIVPESQTKKCPWALIQN